MTSKKYSKVNNEYTMIAEKLGTNPGERVFVVKQPKSLMKDRHATIVLKDDPKYFGKPMTSRYAELIDFHITNEKNEEHRRPKNKKFFFML